MSEAEIAQRVIGLIDATNLSDDCTDADVVALCEAASEGSGSVAGVCVHPPFVALAREHVGDNADAPDEAAPGAGSRDRVAVVTVVNFPGGDQSVDDVVAATDAALSDGADEIDVVLPYRRFLGGDTEHAAAVLDAVRDAVGEQHVLKVIVESGAMSDRAQIDAAARFAVEHGADFVKTSTGKIEVSATAEAVETILGVLSIAERQVGVKVSGGVRSLADAAEYLALADRIMGDGWVSPATFRFGSSSLLATARTALPADDNDDSDAENPDTHDEAAS